ncbi:uncharacterized protein LOC100878100 isoform X1 [Megachile rotundata]|uniref:uncharacterized protein LOC100878100 isoform X1 n=1 Tax=Megachile rotundata TaxID=143995 RepID=UPI003FD499C7
MSDKKNKSYVRTKYRVQKKNTEHANFKMPSNKNVDEYLHGSQNFCLRWSPGSTDSNIQNVVTPSENDIIVISDSSCKSTSPSPTCNSKSSSTLKTQSNRSKNVYILDSSDSDIEAEKDDKFFQAWRKNKNINFINHNRERRDIKKSTAQYTSDESSPNSPKHCKRFVRHINESSSSDSVSEHTAKNISKSNVQIHNNVANKVTSSSDYTSCRSNPINVECKIQPTKNLLIKNKKNVTRRDFQSIIKNIKSTKMVYESPKTIRRDNVTSDEDINDIHPAISTDRKETNNKIIDETPVDSESDIVQSSQVNSANVYKTPINRILCKPHENKGEGMTCSELSERKKKQISQWLMTTSPNSQSDTSLSMVPATNKDDVSSGNSSLERLEMNYETPNNRGKIHRTPKNENGITNSDSTKRTNSVTLRQTTLKECIQSKNDTPKPCTLKNNAANTPQNLVITDCQDILDKLYGKSWRDKAHILFTNSEQRKPVIPTRNRAVQTERKPKNKGRCHVTDSEDDDSNTSLQDLKLQKRLPKKNVRKTTKQDSFINDQSSSGSESESLYYTALTNPKLSVNSTQKNKNLKGLQKVLRVCDTDTEDEDKESDNNEYDAARKKLSFDNDEIEDSSTSEFDPGDEIPPKSTTKKELTKIPREIPKATNKNKPTSNNQKYNSFLSSLSENVPITCAHPDARKYRLNYKNTKEDLCNYLYKLYNEKVFDKKLPEDMTIEWNVRMRGTAGFCYNKKSIKTLGGVVKSSRIVLATKILDTPDRLRDTLIHEMCHAAAWLINDVSDGHGPFWTGWANKAMKTFPELPPIRRCHDYKIKTKFTYRCVNCGYSIGRHSKSLDTEKKRCGHCFGKFELLVNKTTKSGTVQVQTPSREPSGFALYVKENYNTVKKERNIRHAEIMKILGQQFSAIKIATKQKNFENEEDNSVLNKQ